MIPISAIHITELRYPLIRAWVFVPACSYTLTFPGNLFPIWCCLRFPSGFMEGSRMVWRWSYRMLQTEAQSVRAEINSVNVSTIKPKDLSPSDSLFLLISFSKELFSHPISLRWSNTPPNELANRVDWNTSTPTYPETLWVHSLCGQIAQMCATLECTQVLTRPSQIMCVPQFNQCVMGAVGHNHLLRMHQNQYWHTKTKIHQGRGYAQTLLLTHTVLLRISKG